MHIGVWHINVCAKLTSNMSRPAKCRGGAKAKVKAKPSYANANDDVARHV
jgi:hypothetical protein